MELFQLRYTFLDFYHIRINCDLYKVPIEFSRLEGCTWSGSKKEGLTKLQGGG